MVGRLLGASGLLVRVLVRRVTNWTALVVLEQTEWLWWSMVVDLGHARGRVVVGQPDVLVVTEKKL